MNQSPLSGKRHFQRPLGRSPQTFFLFAVVTAALLFPALPAGAQTPSPSPESLVNPTLTVHPRNHRYFMLADSCEAIYLAGTHHSNNLQDFSSTYPPQAADLFPFDSTYPPTDAPNANFIRGWHWEGSSYAPSWISPLFFARTGPGNANDGRPRFSLTQYDGSYVSRLQSRGYSANSKGMYLSV